MASPNITDHCPADDMMGLALSDEFPSQLAFILQWPPERLLRVLAFIDEDGERQAARDAAVDVYKVSGDAATVETLLEDYLEVLEERERRQAFEDRYCDREAV